MATVPTIDVYEEKVASAAARVLRSNSAAQPVKVSFRSNIEDAHAIETPVLDSQHVETDGETSLFRESIYASGLRNVQTFVDSGIVVLRGRVQSFYLKQIAQKLAREQFQDAELLNAIEVVQVPTRSKRPGFWNHSVRSTNAGCETGSERSTAKPPEKGDRS